MGSIPSAEGRNAGPIGPRQFDAGGRATGDRIGDDAAVGHVHVVGAVLAHVGVPGVAPIAAMGLFFVAIGAAVGAYWLNGRVDAPYRRVGRIGLIGVAVACLATATAMPFIVHATPLFERPASTAKLAFVSPRPDQVVRGDPATLPVHLRLDGGKIVVTSSLHLIPNEGHIHLYLDGSLLAMTWLDTSIIVLPGEHTLKAEFVAVDHGSFRPPVTATVTFNVIA